MHSKKECVIKGESGRGLVRAILTNFAGSLGASPLNIQDMISTKAKGFIAGAIAAATYGMNPLFALPLYGLGWGASDVLLYRYVFGAVILYCMIRLRGQSLRLEPRQFKHLLGLGLLFGFSSLSLFESYNYMAAGIASTMLFVYPLMVAVIMTICYHEHLRPLTIICLLMATGGIGLLYKGDGGATLSAAGTALVMLSSLSYAIYLVWVNRPVLKPLPSLVLTFYVILFGSVVFMVGPLRSGSLAVPTSALSWSCVLALGLLPTVVSLVCTTMAIQAIGSTPTAILGALEPLTAVFFGITLFGETLTGRDVIGLSLILVAVTLVIAGNNISGVLLRMRRLKKIVMHVADHMHH